MIQHAEDEDLQRRFEARHLVMRTSLHPYEFIGIKYLINNCPDLESLTLQMVHRPMIHPRPMKVIN